MATSCSLVDVDPCVQIYSMGDMDVLKAAMTGVSMLFDPGNTDTWVGGAGLGLGAAVGVGLMFTLIIMLLQAVKSMKFELGNIIMLIIIYAAMFVPKFDIQIEDIYSGQIGRVDSLPMGVALPAGIVSSLTREVTEKLEIAFSTTNGNYMSVSANGMLSPLRILNSLRSSGKSMQYYAPGLSATIQEFVANCYNGRDGVSQKDLYMTSDVIDKLTAPAIAGTVVGLTRIYPDVGSTPIGSTCEAAANSIKTRVGLLFSGTAKDADGNPFNANFTAGGVANSMTPFEMAINTTGKQAFTSGKAISLGDYTTAMTALTGAAATDAQKFATTSLFAFAVNEGFRCSAAASTSSGMASCAALESSVRQWQEDAAGAATGFQRIMISGMNIMLFMFYVFAPVMAIVMVFMGERGLKVAGNYLLFGVWTQSWLPVATMINFYMQTQVERELQRWGGMSTGGSPITAQFLNMNTAPQFYSMLADKIALGGDMMASVPIITLALLSGSMYALTSVANRWGGKDYYDEKVNSPAMVGSAPVAQVQSGMQGTHGHSTALSSGMASPFTVQQGSVFSSALQASKASLESQSAGLRQSIDNTIRDTYSSSTKADFSRMAGDAVKGSKIENVQAVDSLLNSLRHSDGENRSKAIQTLGEMGLSGNISKLGSMLAKDPRAQAALSALSLTVGEKGQLIAANSDTTAESLEIAKAINTISTNSGSIDQSKLWEAKTAYSKSYSRSNDDSRAKSLTQNFDMLSSYQEQTTFLEGVQSNSAITKQITAEQMANAVSDDNESPLASSMRQQLDNSFNSMTPSQKQQVAKLTEGYSLTSLRSNKTPTLQRLATFEVLRTSSNNDDKIAAAALLARYNGIDPTPISQSPAERNKGVGAPAADANQVVAPGAGPSRTEIDSRIDNASSATASPGAALAFGRGAMSGAESVANRKTTEMYDSIFAGRDEELAKQESAQAVAVNTASRAIPEEAKTATTQLGQNAMAMTTAGQSSGHLAQRGAFVETMIQQSGGVNGFFQVEKWEQQMDLRQKAAKGLRMEAQHLEKSIDYDKRSVAGREFYTGNPKVESVYREQANLARELAASLEGNVPYDQNAYTKLMGKFHENAKLLKDDPSSPK